MKRGQPRRKLLWVFVCLFYFSFLINQRINGTYLLFVFTSCQVASQRVYTMRNEQNREIGIPITSDCNNFFRLIFNICLLAIWKSKINCCPTVLCRMWEFPPSVLRHPGPADHLPSIRRPATTHLPGFWYLLFYCTSAGPSYFPVSEVIA